MSINLKYCDSPRDIEVSLWSEICQVRNVFTDFFCRPPNIGKHDNLSKYQNEFTIVLMEAIKESDES